MEQKVISLDSQILNSIQACARKTELTFVKNLKTPIKASPLEKGSLMHDMLEIYYALKGKCVHSGMKWPSELKELGILDSSDPDDLNRNELTHESIVKLAIEAGTYNATKINLDADTSASIIYQFREYTSFYQHDAWHPLAVEEVGSKILWEDESLKIIYNFKIDLIAEKGSIIAPWDHKTSSRREEPTSMSNQFIGYCFGLDMNNIVINKIGFQKTLKPSERFQRFTLPISQDRIDEWQENSIIWARRLGEAVTLNRFEMNLTSCDKYGGCIYIPICESAPSLRERKEDQDFIVGEKWDVANVLEAKK